MFKNILASVLLFVSVSAFAGNSVGADLVKLRNYKMDCENRVTDIIVRKSSENDPKYLFGWESYGIFAYKDHSGYASLLMGDMYTLVFEDGDIYPVETNRILPLLYTDYYLEVKR